MANTLSDVLKWLIGHGAPVPTIQSHVDVTPAGVVVNHLLTFTRPGVDPTDIPWYQDLRDHVVVNADTLTTNPPQTLTELIGLGLANGDPHITYPYPDPPPPTLVVTPGVIDDVVGLPDPGMVGAYFGTAPGAITYSDGFKHKVYASQLEFVVRTIGAPGSMFSIKRWFVLPPSLA